MKFQILTSMLLSVFTVNSFAGTVNCKVEAVENDTQKSLGKISYDLKRDEYLPFKGALVDGRFVYQIDVTEQGVQAFITDINSQVSAFGLDLTKRITGPGTLANVPTSLFVVGSFTPTNPGEPRVNVTVFCLEAPGSK